MLPIEDNCRTGYPGTHDLRHYPGSRTHAPPPRCLVARRIRIYPRRRSQRHIRCRASALPERLPGRVQRRERPHHVVIDRLHDGHVHRVGLVGRAAHPGGAGAKSSMTWRAVIANHGATSHAVPGSCPVASGRTVTRGRPTLVTGLSGDVPRKTGRRTKLLTPFSQLKQLLFF